MDAGLLATLLGSLGGVVTTLVGLFIANRAGLGQTQEKLVNSLKDFVSVQQSKIESLEAQAKENTAKIADLTIEVKTLRDLTVRQAKMIDRLQRRRGLSTHEDQEEDRP